MPALNTDFSDELYLFVDEAANIGIAVTSTGDDVLILIADIVENPATFVVGGAPFSEDVVFIDYAVIDDLIVGANGEGVRLDNGSVFQVNNLSAFGVPFGLDLEGECAEVGILDTSATSALQSFVSDLGATRGFGDRSTGNVQDFLNEINNTGE